MKTIGTGTMTISRPRYRDGRKKMKITIRDEKSRIRFVEAEIDLDKFSECLTGLAEVECEIETHDLETEDNYTDSENLCDKIHAAIMNTKAI